MMGYAGRRLEPRRSNGTQEVEAFEELVGSHGGLGGPQTKPFILFPGHWSIEDGNILGAHKVYSILCRWRDEELTQSD